MRENCVKSLALDKRIFSARVPSGFSRRPRAGSWNCSPCGQLESKSYMKPQLLRGPSGGFSLSFQHMFGHILDSHWPLSFSVDSGELGDDHSQRERGRGVAGPRNKGLERRFPPGSCLFSLSSDDLGSYLMEKREAIHMPSHGRLWQFAQPRPLSLLQRGLAPRSKGKARAELRPARPRMAASHSWWETPSVGRERRRSLGPLPPSSLVWCSHLPNRVTTSACLHPRVPEGPKSSSQSTAGSPEPWGPT